MTSRAKRIVSALVVVSAIALTGCDTPESLFPTLTDTYRAEKGAPALATGANLPGGAPIYNYVYGKARAHSQWMCTTGKLEASPRGEYGEWMKFGENVAWGDWNSYGGEAVWTANTKMIFNALKNSKRHSDNMLDVEFKYQVVAHYECGSKMYVTHLFMK